MDGSSGFANASGSSSDFFRVGGEMLNSITSGSLETLLCGSKMAVSPTAFGVKFCGERVTVRSKCFDFTLGPSYNVAQVAFSDIFFPLNEGLADLVLAVIPGDSVRLGICINNDSLFDFWK